MKANEKEIGVGTGCEFYKTILDRSPAGYAYHKIILDVDGRPCDYEFVEVNQIFGEISGINCPNIIGKKITEIYPNFKNEKFDWIGYYGEIALANEERDFEQYSESVKKWFRVMTFSPKKYYFATIFIDISEEKKRLEELNNFFEVNLDMLCIADTKGNFIKLNKTWENILGYSMEELLNTNYLEFVHADDIEKTLETMTRLDQQKQVLNFANRYRCKDGTYRWIEWRSQPKGDVVYAAARDITEHKNLEESLRKEEEKYRQITENISDIVWAADLDFKTSYVSPSVKNIIGDSVQDYLRRSLEEKYPVTSIKKMRGILLEELEKEKNPKTDKHRTRLFDVEQYKADGSIIWVNLHVSFRRDKYGKAIGIQGVTRDITEQKKLQISLQQEQLFNQKLIDSMPGIFYLYTYPELKLVLYNNNHASLLGYETSEIANRHLLDWHLPEAKAAVQQVVDEVMIKGHDVLESPLLSKAGEYVPFLMTGVSFDTPQQRYLMGIGVDLIERKKIEEQVYLEKEQFKTTLLSVGDGVISCDKEGNVLILNKVAEILTGWTQEEALGKPMDDVFNIVNEYTRESCENPVNKVLGTGRIIELANHTILISKDKSEKPIEDSAAPIRDMKGNINGVVLVFRDFTEKKEKHDRIEYLSFHDQLTGLYNRRYYEDNLAQLDKPQNLPLTIVMGDLNGLKLVNDSFGHELGDALLWKAAEVMKKGCRTDDIISRIGGDEFVLILPRTGAEEAAKIVERIKSLAASEQAGSISVSISFGIETKYAEVEKIQDTFKKAEDKMYKEKLFESPSMRAKTINTIIKTLQERSQREKEHSWKVSELCESLGKALELSEYKINELRTLGLLHDIGKIAIDENILNNPNKLTDDECYAIKRHSEIGYRILSTVNEMSEMAEYILAHHERWDGTGYPKGLKAAEIPFESSIIAVADAYDAMTSDRVYCKGLTEDEALAELEKNAGIQFNPEIVKAFIEKVLKKAENENN